MATGRIGFFLEPDIQDTLNWSRKWLVDFNAGKTQLVSFYRSNDTGSIYMKKIVLFLRKIAGVDFLF